MKTVFHRAGLISLAFAIGFASLSYGGIRAKSEAATMSPGPRKPNIIYIMVDDMGYGDLGVYGQTKIRTPRLDQMANEGMRFTQFYSGSTIWAPTRSTLMTGLHTGHT